MAGHERRNGVGFLFVEGRGIDAGRRGGRHCRACSCRCAAGENGQNKCRESSLVILRSLGG